MRVIVAIVAAVLFAAFGVGVIKQSFHRILAASDAMADLWSWLRRAARAPLPALSEFHSYKHLLCCNDACIEKSRLLLQAYIYLCLQIFDRFGVSYLVVKAAPQAVKSAVGRCGYGGLSATKS
jgi:hypothetical protein